MLYSLIETPIGIRRVKGLTVVSPDDAIIEVDNGTTHDAKLCSGIPLTPEWLERCGLIKQGEESKHNYEVWGNRNIELARVDDGYALHVQDLDEYASWTIYKAVQYLHQLQNLYFALTGEELNVKL